ncbi:MAG: hypothetical protein WBG64_00760 [Thermoanaerobaculia bacterium]
MTDSAATLELGPDRSGRELQLVDDRVSSYGPPSATESASDRRLDCSRGTLAPGRVNAHTHIYSGLAPLGMPPP